MRMPKLALGIGGALFALFVGLLLGVGLSAMDAAGREETPPEGWTFARVDSPNDRALPAGPLRPRRDRMSLSARLGVATSTQWLTGIDLTFELPQDGLLEIELAGLLNNPSVVLLLQAGDQQRGGAAWALQTMVNSAGYGSAPEPDRQLLTCDPEVLPPIAPGVHTLAVNFRESPWSLNLDGQVWGTCELSAQSFSGITLSPGQRRIQILSLVRHELNREITERFGRRRYDPGLLVGGALFALALGELLMRAGARRRGALVALVTLAAALPLSWLDLRVVAARFRLLPLAAGTLPAWLSLGALLIALALLPTGATKLGGRIRRWGAGLTIFVALITVYRRDGMLVAGMAVAAFPATLAWTLGWGDLRALVGRAWAFAGLGALLGWGVGMPWGGHVLLFGGLVGALSVVPEIPRASLRPGKGLALAVALLLSVGVGVELLVRAGPQDQTWSSAALAEAVPGTPNPATAGSKDLIPSEASVESKCKPDRENQTSSIVVTVFGGGAATTDAVGFRNQFFPKLLEWGWNADNPSNTIQVFNQGVPGWTSFEIAKCAPKLLDSIGPTLVLMYLGWEDLSGPGSVLYRVDQSRQAAGRSAAARLLDRSSLVRLLRFGLSGFNHASNACPVPVADARRNIEIVANAAKHVGAHTLLVSEATFPRADALADYRAMLQRLADSRDDVEFLDAAQIFEGYMNPYYFGDDHHLTTAGHRQLVKELQAELEAKPDLIGGS